MVVLFVRENIKSCFILFMKGFNVSLVSQLGEVQATGAAADWMSVYGWVVITPTPLFFQEIYKTLKLVPVYLWWNFVEG